LCDRLGIVDRGRIVAEDTPAALKASVASDSLEHVYLHYTGHDFGAAEGTLAVREQAA
jgi:ABC-type multidrug transport system ATPase subunit